MGAAAAPGMTSGFASFAAGIPAADALAIGLMKLKGIAGR